MVTFAICLTVDENSVPILSPSERKKLLMGRDVWRGDARYSNRFGVIYEIKTIPGHSCEVHRKIGKVVEV